MTLSVEPLKKLNLFQDLLYLNNNNFFIAFISSTFFTGIIQSSSATIAMTIIIAEKGLINIKEAIIIILGANIGTCITAMLAAVNANNAAKKTALAHLILNVYGAVLFFFLINPFTFFITFTSSNISNQIANAHTFYNLICSLTVLPFSKKYAYLIETLYKE
jgi:phosphate:Na+ symporter